MALQECHLPCIDIWLYMVTNSSLARMNFSFAGCQCQGKFSTFSNSSVGLWITSQKHKIKHFYHRRAVVILSSLFISLTFLLDLSCKVLRKSMVFYNLWVLTIVEVSSWLGSLPAVKRLADFLLWCTFVGVGKGRWTSSC